MELSKCVLSSAETMNEDPISTLQTFFFRFLSHIYKMRLKVVV